MPIFKGSRYENIPITTIIRKDGIPRPFINRRDKLSIDDLENNFFVYTAVEEDAIDLISFKSGNSSLKWWVISYVNDIFFPLEALEGKSIIIPSNSFMNAPKKAT